MLIVFVSKGRAAAEAASCLHRLETRLTGIDGRSAVIATVPRVRAHSGREDVVDFAALGADRLFDPDVRRSCDAVVAVAEGGRSDIEALAQAVGVANETSGAPVFLLGSGRHHPSQPCPVLPLRHPMLSPGAGYARTLYIAVLREIRSSVRGCAMRDGRLRPLIANRLRLLGADRPAPTTSSRRRRAERRTASFPGMHAGERSAALGGAR